MLTCEHFSKRFQNPAVGHRRVFIFLCRITAGGESLRYWEFRVLSLAKVKELRELRDNQKGGCCNKGDMMRKGIM